MIKKSKTYHYLAIAAARYSVDWLICRVLKSFNYGLNWIYDQSRAVIVMY